MSGSLDLAMARLDVHLGIAAPADAYVRARARAEACARLAVDALDRAYVLVDAAREERESSIAWSNASAEFAREAARLAPESPWLAAPRSVDGEEQAA